MNPTNKVRAFVLLCLAAGGASLLLNHKKVQNFAFGMVADLRPPLVIAPHIAGLSFCPSAFMNDQVKNNEHAAEYCYSKKETASEIIERLLSKLGNKKVDHFELGYTLTLPLTRYFIRDERGQWLVDVDRIEYDLRVASEIDRPVHIYLNFNHFAAGNEEFARDLAKDNSNLMWNSAGPLPITNYFGTAIIPWTLQNLEAPVSQYKEQVLREALARIKKLNQSLPERVIGVSLFGESHHLDPDLSAGPSYSVDLASTTDYSPYAISQFQQYLKAKYKTITQLNQAASTRYQNFSEVSPYSSNGEQSQTTITKNSGLSNNNTGTIDFYGWFLDRNKRCQSELQVDLNRRQIAAIPVELNRTDVAEALAITNPNVGFRFTLDTKRLAPGRHFLAFFAVCNGANVLIAQRSVTMQASRQLPQRISQPISTSRPVQADSPLGVAFHLDGPADSLSVNYNLIAAQWQQFRRASVRRYLEHYGRIAQEYLPANLIYSYQISTIYNGSWNPQVTAESDSNLPSQWYQYGATLYGGAAFGDPFFNALRKHGVRRYAVTESNPMSNLGVSGYISFFEKHRRAGAVFVAPYYLSVISDHLPSGELNYFELKPNNTKKYADQYYAALRKIMQSD